ncbi:hypothetical protein EH240_23335 [Mesorhizobium tamadayense]|uniref:TonB-dependent receptor plug domain-containing protein n=1 Tax=Mesorhizobium tamadayense TaxID=425306 RepID=A0A3P3FCL5_9HYPH|nr:iron chelate uptake ABC transporter family permease subunit [Mesorhizobium tamadayense]RRH95946.1 hypothetical protein EH240_23335 [Mesorhizobium tamadayense]
MANRRVLAGLLLATTFLHAPHALAQEKQDVLAPIEIEGEAGNGSADFDGYKAKKDAGAGKSDQPLEKTPQAVSVVGSRQIEDQAARSVVEATRYSPGIRSETFGNDTRNDWFLIRGFSSQVSSYFLDGLQLQSSDGFATWKVAAPLAGAALVLLVDQLIQRLPPDQAANLPTGAVTALIGAPMLILLLRRVPRLMLETGGGIATRLGGGSARRPMVVLAGLAIALALVLALAFLLGRAPDGFGLYPEAFAWRLPRVIAACGSGLGLGVAGCLVQRLFANPMASPEILGIGGGVAMGSIAVLLIFADASAGLQLLGATVGALTVTGAILLLGLDRGFTPERLLLTGIAITALLDASSLLFLALGDPRSGQVLTWLSGSTYWVELHFAIVVLCAGLAGLALSVLACRWLEILPLGAGIATSLGIPLRAARLAVLALAAITTAAAALVVGPMSSVGLLAPHLAGLMDLRRAGPQLIGAAITGAVLVVFADWTGRVVFAPTELPAGVLSVLIGSLAAMGAAMVRRAAR